ncbi:MAG: HU family DNA-binding protein [Gammaproteobacteria bacterium]
MSGTITRREIALRLQDEVGSLSEARRFTDEFFDALASGIASHDKIKIHNFGVFRRVRKKARAGRNPKTGEFAAVSARRVVNFVAGRAFKNRLAEYDENS